MSNPTGADVLVQELERLGVERIFTLSGNQILSIYDACLDHGIAVTDTRHEAAAGHMADAWARLRGEPGVCLVSAGPGHTNALTSILNARASESPVLWLSGGSDLAVAGRGGFQEIDQVGLASAACKAAWYVRSASELPALLARAWQVMQEDRPGPVHLTLPADLLARPVGGEISPGDKGTGEPNGSVIDPDLVHRALSILASASRPLFLASPSAVRGKTGQAVARLSARTGIPCFPVESPRGLTDPAWHHQGQLVSEADAVLMLAPFDFAVAFGGPKSFGSGCSIVQIAPASRKPGESPSIALALTGDAGSILGHLLSRCDDFTWDALAWRERLAARRSTALDELRPFAESDESPIHPLRLATELRNVLPTGAIIAQDGGEFAQWVRWAFGGTDFSTLVNGKLGMIGPSIPFAIGAALARPDVPAVACLGDGTAGYHIMEFDTAIRHRIPFLAIVGNDAAWAAERHRQIALYGPERLVAADLLPSRYDEVVRALGGHGEYVERPDEIRPALERALASGLPACVNVRIQSVQSPAAPV
jgi:acetolactate synthase I/II/III large subunit